MSRSPQERIARRLPKIDLHVHLEGSLPRSTLAGLAARHRLAVPRLRGFDGFGGFLRSFGEVCDLIADEEDFERAARDLFEAQGRIGVVHLEVLFSAQVFLRRGIAPGTMMRGLLRARQRAVRGGLSIVYVLDGVRQWGGEWFDETVRMMAPWAGRGLAGIGVGGDEAARPARDFARAFARARALGMRTTVHAGEAAGAPSVREALEVLKVDRIGHGVAAAEDPALMADLASRGVTLEVCPTSNVATGAAASWRAHPLRRLYDAGVPVTLNSDDGAFFGTDVAIELNRAARELAFSRAELSRLMENAARAAFLPQRRRERLVAAVVAGWREPAPRRLLRARRWRRSAG